MATALQSLPLTAVQRDDSPQREYVQHFIMGSIDEVILQCLQTHSKCSPGSPFQLLEFEDTFYGRALAENHYVWIKERKVIAQPISKLRDSPPASAWSIKLLSRFQPQGLPLSFVAFVGDELKTVLAQAKDLLPPGLHGYHVGDLQPFLCLKTSRLCVDQEGDASGVKTTCWIDSTCDKEAQLPYNVSCGMRYTNRARAVKLWKRNFGPLAGSILGVPSKALVFSGIYAHASEADQSHFAHPSLGYRSVNPLAIPVPPEDSVVLLDDNITRWAEAWCKRLRHGPPQGFEHFALSDMECQSMLLEKLVAVARRVQQFQLTPERLMRLGPVGICALALSTPPSSHDKPSEDVAGVGVGVGVGVGGDITSATRSWLAAAAGDYTHQPPPPPPAELVQAIDRNYRQLDSDQQLTLAGLCGLLHVWRSPQVFLTEFEKTRVLAEEDVSRFCTSTTSCEMLYLRSYLEALEHSRALIPAHQTLLDHIRAAFPLQQKLEHDFVAFQRLTVGIGIYRNCI
jgi:hypothetical protein